MNSSMAGIVGRVASAVRMSCVVLNVAEQRANATCTRASVASTWSCTSCQLTSAEACASSVATTRTDATATTARKDSTAVAINPSTIARLADVSNANTRQLTADYMTIALHVCLQKTRQAVMSIDTDQF